MPRNRWVNRLIVILIVALPVVAFFITQAISSHTRSGAVEELWFVDLPPGRPAVVVRDAIRVGTEAQGRVRRRLALVDLQSGSRLARVPVDAELRLFAVAQEGLWFHEHPGRGDPHLRDLLTLRRLQTAASPPAEQVGPRPRPLSSRATVGQTEVDATALAQAQQPAGFLVDGRTGGLLVVGSDPLLVHQDAQAEHEGLRLVRLRPDGQHAWSTPLERQRVVLAATVVDQAVVVISRGAVRNFALSVELESGRLNWVHPF